MVWNDRVGRRRGREGFTVSPCDGIVQDSAVVSSGHGLLAGRHRSISVGAWSTTTRNRRQAWSRKSSVAEPRAAALSGVVSL
ncbi:hypothetical protein ACFY1U_33900 [Streptomyces sp. NPDC001351]|uniref:hypothetical protein n=1 Tax=Streptomyces sp. NPDC001351 TaxID=3364564 RepID=UPI0036977B86